SSTSAANSNKPTLEIGVQGPLSGANQALGVNIDWGVKLAVQQENAKGDLPHTLALKEADDQGDEYKGALAAGALASTAALVAVSVATRPSLPSSGFKTFYRVVANDNVQGPAAADYM